VTLRKLQWWDETGYITPGRNVRKRFYDPEAADEARLTSWLMDRGITFPKCRLLLPELRKRRLVSKLVARLDSLDVGWTDTGVIFAQRHKAIRVEING
jgi:DNA-binding transcriptional MerR regulator